MILSQDTRQHREASEFVIRAAALQNLGVDAKFAILEPELAASSEAA